MPSRRPRLIRTGRASGKILFVLGFFIFVASIIVRSIIENSDALGRLANQTQVWGFAGAMVGWLLNSRDRTPDHLTQDQEYEVILQTAQKLLPSSRDRYEKLLAKRPEAQLTFERSGEDIQGEGARWSSTDALLDYFMNSKNKRLVVLGSPGSGKTFAVHRAVNELYDRKLNRDTQDALPIAIQASISLWDTALKFDDWFVDFLHDNHNLRKTTARQLIEERLIIPVLDGLDEMDDAANAPIRAMHALKQLNDTLSRPLIVTCRTETYQRIKALQLENRDTVGLTMATVIELKPMHSSEIARYLNGSFTSLEERNLWQPVLRVIEQDPDGELAQELSNPFKLAMLRSVYQSGMDINDLIGKSRGELESILFKRFIPASLDEVDSHSAKVTRVSTWLTSLALYLDLQQKAGRSGSDVALHDLWRFNGTKLVARIHALLALIVLAVLGLASYFVLPNGSWTLSRWVSLIFIAGVMLVGLARVFFGVEQSPMHPRYRQLFSTKVGLFQLSVASFGVFVSAESVLPVHGSLPVMIASGGLGGFFGGLIIGFILGIMARGTNTELVGVVSPREPLSHSLYFSVPVGMAFAAIFGAIESSTHPARNSLGFAIMYAAIFALVFGLPLVSIAWFRFAISIILAAARRRLPLRIGVFLDDACDLGLMRTAGISYQFRHNSFQKWLSSDTNGLTVPSQPGVLPGLPDKHENDVVG